MIANKTLPLACLLPLALVLGCASSGEERAAPEPEAAAAASDRLTAADQAWMSLTDMAGQTHDLDRALSAGRGVALVFWQSWCAACIREAPHVVAASNRLRGELDFYGVVSGPDDVVDESAVADMTRELSLPYPQVRDRSGQLARRFGVRGTPTVVVIEPDGRVSHNGHELPAGWLAPH